MAWIQEYTGPLNRKKSEDPESEDVLEEVSIRMHESGYHPPGLEEEWDDQGIIHEGIRGKKESFVGLPADIWKPRALQWVQSLVAMESVLAQESVL